MQHRDDGTHIASESIAGTTQARVSEGRKKAQPLVAVLGWKYGPFALPGEAWITKQPWFRSFSNDAQRLRIGVDFPQGAFCNEWRMFMHSAIAARS